MSRATSVFLGLQPSPGHWSIWVLGPRTVTCSSRGAGVQGLGEGGWKPPSPVCMARGVRSVWESQDLLGSSGLGMRGCGEQKG